MTYQAATTIDQNVVAPGVGARLFAQLTSTGVSVATAPTQVILGVTSAQETTVGAAAAIAKPDGARVEVVAGAALAIGTRVTTDAAGRAVAATTGQLVRGYVVKAAGAADEIADIILVNEGPAA